MESKLLNIDCLEYMKDVEDNYFELAIVDPPYGLQWGAISDILECGDLVKLRAGNEDAKKWDIKPIKEYFDELKRVSVNQIIWGYNYLTEHLGNSNNLIVWDKAVTGNKFLSRFEMAYCSFNVSIIKKISVKRYTDKIHPCQKPVALYRWLLQNYAKPNDKIFDSHVGSGSSLIACIEEGFDYVGCEIDKDYYESAKNRIDIFQSQGRMF